MNDDDRLVRALERIASDLDAIRWTLLVLGGLQLATIAELLIVR